MFIKAKQDTLFSNRSTSKYNLKETFAYFNQNTRSIVFPKALLTIDKNLKPYNFSSTG